jgi:hypothetical protein
MPAGRLQPGPGDPLDEPGWSLGSQDQAGTTTATALRPAVLADLNRAGSRESTLPAPLVAPPRRSHLISNTCSPQWGEQGGRSLRFPPPLPTVAEDGSNSARATADQRLSTEKRQSNPTEPRPGATYPPSACAASCSSPPNWSSRRSAFALPPTPSPGRPADARRRLQARVHLDLALRHRPRSADRPPTPADQGRLPDQEGRRTSPGRSDRPMARRTTRKATRP